MNEKSVTNEDILEAINSFSSDVDKEFQGLKDDVKGLKDDVKGLKDDVKGLKDDVKELKQRTSRIESTMVTKDYLDEKLADFRGDLTVLIRKEDTKWSTLLHILFQHKLITEEEKTRVLSLEPFPQLSL